MSRAFVRRCDRPHNSRVWNDPRYCPCNDAARYKYACLECRRTFKLATNRSINEYHIGMHVMVGPKRTRIPEVWVRWNRLQAAAKGDPAFCRRNARDYYSEIHFQGTSSMSEEERNEMKAWCPEVWWQRLDNLHCPECGKEGKRVKAAFEPPPRRHKKAWDKIKQALRDEGSSESNGCRTAAVERDRESRRPRDAYLQDKEKRRRIEELKAAQCDGKRTQDELRKLQNIRRIRMSRGQAACAAEEAQSFDAAS